MNELCNCTSLMDVSQSYKFLESKSKKVQNKVKTERNIGKTSFNVFLFLLFVLSQSSLLVIFVKFF